MKVHRGGPVETTRGFDDDVCLTATIEILKAIADGRGPANALLALGYAGWAPGQLETEIQANGWLFCPASADIIFNPDLDAKYERALAQLGIDPARLASDAGHA
jgi:putative transcriptional regulator